MVAAGRRPLAAAWPGRREIGDARFARAAGPRVRRSDTRRLDTARLGRPLTEEDGRCGEQRAGGGRVERQRPISTDPT